MAFTPLHDDNPLKIIPFQYMTVGLIALNVVIFFLFQAPQADEAYLLSVGFIPGELMGGVEPRGAIPEWLTPFTSMFLHGDFWHLLGNMLFLWVYGDNIEDILGHWRFLLFYVICGLAAAAAHGFSDPGSDIAMIGASGAIAGVIGAYLVFFPKVKIWVLVFFKIPLRLPAYLILGVWIGLQLFSVAAGAADGVAWWAHIGGFVAGAGFAFIQKQRGKLHHEPETQLLITSVPQVGRAN